MQSWWRRLGRATRAPSARSLSGISIWPAASPGASWPTRSSEGSWRRRRCYRRTCRWTASGTGERFQSWLYGIVLNVCRSHLRDQKTDLFSLEALSGGLRFEAVPFTGIEPDPQEEAEAQELHQVVLQAVNALSPRNRAATLLFYYEQLSVREAAATLGVSVAAVKGRLHKSRHQLRELLMPVYPGLSSKIPQAQEVKKMVKVTIADVIAREIRNEETGETSTQHVVVLLDQEGQRVLPLWIGTAEGNAIAFGLREYQVPRPMTHDFIATLIEAIGAELEEVRVEELKEDTFIAVAKLRTGDKVREVDARPSDAFALAVRTGSPIYAAEEVISKGGLPIPEDVGETQVLSKGLDSIFKEIDERREKYRQVEAKAKKTYKDYLKSPDKQEKARQNLMAYLFGSPSEAGKADPKTD